MRSFFRDFCTSARTTKYAIILLLIASYSFEYFMGYADKSRAFNINAYKLKLLVVKDRIRNTVKTLNSLKSVNISVCINVYQLFRLQL